MSQFFEETMQGLLEAVAISKGEIPLVEKLETMSEILAAYSFTAEKLIEEDGSITLALREIDLVENGDSEETARMLLAKAIMEYAAEYYENYVLYSKDPNRKGHIPYVFKALITDDMTQIGESIVCHDGEN